MKYYRFIHFLAVGALIWVAASSSLAASTGPAFPWIDRQLRAVGIVQVWGLMAFAVWNRPEKWAFRMGVFLGLILLFQIYLWSLAVASPHHIPGLNYSPVAFVLDELPLVVATVCCLLIKWTYPRIPEIPQAPAAHS